MQQPRRSSAKAGVALVSVGVIAVATLVPPPAMQPPPGIAGVGAVGLTASAASDEILQAVAADSGVLFELFAPLLSLLESTYLASVLLVEAFASLDPLQILLAIIQFPELAFLPPLVVIINDITGGSTVGTSGGGDEGPTPAAGLDALHLHDVAGELSASTTSMLEAVDLDPGIAIP